MRWLVCGGRDFGDAVGLFRVLDRLATLRGKPVAVIHGAARGADTIAGRWARAHGIEVDEFVADWSAFGKAAGAKRNQRMLEDGKPDIVVAFAGGRGTADMVKRARSAKVETIEIPAGA